MSTLLLLGFIHFIFQDIVVFYVEVCIPYTAAMQPEGLSIPYTYICQCMCMSTVDQKSFHQTSLAKYNVLATFFSLHIPYTA